jgi:hypothetical protein
MSGISMDFFGEIEISWFFSPDVWDGISVFFLEKNRGEK